MGLPGGAPLASHDRAAAPRIAGPTAAALTITERMNVDIFARQSAPGVGHGYACRIVGVVAFSATADTELGNYDETPVILYRSDELPHPFTDT